jgi:hypothetical protein
MIILAFSLSCHFP